MTLGNQTTIDTTDREIISLRVMGFPQDKVFEAFSNPELLAQWWGPEGFRNTFKTFDFTPGGTWEFVMHGPDGTDYLNTNIFSEITAPERIVFDHVLPPVFQMTISIEKVSTEQTHFGFHMVFDSAETCQAVKAMCGPANEQNFDRLEAVLSKI